MEQWKEYRLGDFMEFNPKRSLSKNTIARKITMDKLVPHTRDIYDWTYEPYSGGAKFQNGDTLMARITPCLENGKQAYVSMLNNGETAFGSTEYIVICGREALCDNRFAYYLSLCPTFRNAAIKSMVGTSGRQRAQVDVLENMTMRLPPLSEQLKIVSILSSLDDKIELNRKINSNLEEQAKALFKSWFIDFEPFKDGKFVDSELGKIPEGWKVCPLEQMGKFKRGKTIVAKNTKKGTVPVVAGGMEPAYYNNVANTKGPVITVSASGANAGFMRLYFQDIWASDCSFLDNTNENLLWIYCFLDNNRRILRYAQTGAVQPHVKPADINSILVCVPVHELIDKFQNVVRPLFLTIGLLHSETMRLQRTRDTLLPKLMSGEIEV